MGPYDYLMHGKKEEKEIFKSDFEELFQ